MSTPKITIGITTYNAGDTVACAVDSALKQTYPNTEVVIVDDHSSDNTHNIIKDLAQNCSKIKIVRHAENLGVAAARNTIINNASGEYIAFFDDDDESVPERISTQLDTLLEYEEQYAPNMVFCHSARLQKFKGNRAFYCMTAGCVTSGGAPPFGGAMARRILIGTPLAHGYGAMATCSQMSRTENYRALNGFDENLRRSEDTDLMIRAALSGAHFIGVSKPLVVQEITMSEDKKIDEEKKAFLFLLEKHKDFIGKYVPIAFLKKWMCIKYDWLSGGSRLQISLSLLHLFCCYPILTIKKVIWAIPGYKENRKQKGFHSDYSAGE